MKTTINEAVEYWSGKVDECELSVDWAEADKRCWRCGCERNLQRCHIVPDSLGGEDKPSNIVLLCKRCHADGPNVTDPEIMWDWIKAYSTLFYDTFWNIRAMSEYRFVYNKSVEDELTEILNISGLNYEELLSKLKQYMDECFLNASTHFAQPYFNTMTLVGVYRMVFKKLRCELGLPAMKVMEN